MKITQVWECPVCGAVYEAPLRVTAVLCPKPHPGSKGHRGGKAEMKLITGELPQAKKARRVRQS